MSERLSRLLVPGLLAATISPGYPGDRPALAVQICNLSRADGRLLSRAEAVAARVYSDAGIESSWLTVEKPEPLELTIQVNPGLSQRSDRKDAFGIAMTDSDPARSFLADVFLGNIEELATSRTDEAFLLGYVMAHEVGHLLGLPHVAQTVMAESWKSRDLPRMAAGLVRFSPNQAERLRAALLLRRQGRLASSVRH